MGRGAACASVALGDPANAVLWEEEPRGGVSGAFCDRWDKGKEKEGGNDFHQDPVFPRLPTRFLS